MVQARKEKEGSEPVILVCHQPLTGRLPQANFNWKNTCVENSNNTYLCFGYFLLFNVTLAVFKFDSGDI